MIPRFGFIEARKWVWEVVKISTGPWVQYADHEQALAKKDREIEAKETELGKLDAELIVCNASYRQLMEKAVWFASQLGVERVSGGLSYIEYPEKAQDFLASPEVQAWKEHHDTGRI